MFDFSRQIDFLPLFVLGHCSVWRDLQIETVQAIDCWEDHASPRWQSIVSATCELTFCNFTANISHK